MIYFSSDSVSECCNACTNPRAPNPPPLPQTPPQAKVQSFRPGEEILRRGALERRLYHVTRGGAACLSAGGGTGGGGGGGVGGGVTLRLGPGEVFGGRHFVDAGDGGARMTVVAEAGGAECLVLSRDAAEMLATVQVCLLVRPP